MSFYLQSLVLRSFRNIKEAHLSFSKGANLIQGDNAQGKTSLLEALSLLSTGRSFRTRYLSELIKEGESAFYIEASFMKDGVVQSVSASFDGKTRTMKHNQTGYPSFIPLLGLLPIVLLVPGDISLLSGHPADRRRFIDLHLSQADPLYLRHLTHYFKAMKQRNHLLRQMDDLAITPWEQIMARSSAYLVPKRAEAAARLAPLLTHFMQLLSGGKDQLDMHYQPSCHDESNPLHFLEKLQKGRRRDMEMKCSHVGPHRDDFLFTIDNREARIFSSEGQKRCLIAALRLAEWQRLQSMVGHPPLIAIDDFGIHLDAERHDHMQSLLKEVGQLFVTSPMSLENALFDEKAFFHMEKGCVRPLG